MGQQPLKIDKEIIKIFEKNMNSLPFLREKSKSSLLLKISYIESQIEYQRNIINKFGKSLAKFQEEIKIIVKQLKNYKKK